VNGLLHDGLLERVSGAAADGFDLIASAQALLASASRENDTNPEASLVLAYDAARKACAALLAQQGLRARSVGHHATTEAVVRAQFGGPFDAFGRMRRRRVEVQHPQFPGDSVSSSEALGAIDLAQQIVAAASTLVHELSLFRE